MVPPVASVVAIDPAGSAHGDGSLNARVHTGDELRQLDKVASVERQIDNLSAVDHLAHSPAFRLQLRCRGAGLHRDRLVHLTYGHFEVLPCCLAGIQVDSGSFLARKAGDLDGERVGSRLEEKAVVYAPSLSVTVVRTALVAASVAVTFAPATTAPVDCR